MTYLETSPERETSGTVQFGNSVTRLRCPCPRWTRRSSTSTSMQDLGPLFSFLSPPVPRQQVALTSWELIRMRIAGQRWEKGVWEVWVAAVKRATETNLCLICLERWEIPWWHFVMSPKVVGVRFFGGRFSEVPQSKYSILFSSKRLWASCWNTKEKSRKT